MLGASEEFGDGVVIVCRGLDGFIVCIVVAVIVDIDETVVEVGDGCWSSMQAVVVKPYE